MAQPGPKTIILIHGAWVTPKCWDRFKSFFEARGCRVLAPAWPYKEGSVEGQNVSPRPELATLGMREIVDHYAAIIAREPEPPILIGHSFGGLFVQLLLARGLGAAGIAIDSAPPKGIFSLYPSVLWSLRLPIATFRGWKRILRWPFAHFRYAFVHTMPPAAQRAAYDGEVVPESGRVFWQAALSPFVNVAKIDFRNGNRAPLLMIAGAEDRITPAIVNRANFHAYQHSSARTDFKEFPKRTHWIIAQEGWQEVAEYCDSWLRTMIGG